MTDGAGALPTQRLLTGVETTRCLSSGWSSSGVCRSGTFTQARAPGRPTCWGALCPLHETRGQLISFPFGQNFRESGQNSIKSLWF